MSFNIKIRFIEDKDAERFLAFRKKLFGETQFMLIEPDEIKMGIEEQRNRIQEINSSGNSRLFVAEAGDELVGFLFAGGGDVRRSAHAAHIVLGILESHQKRGAATALFAALDAWAPTAGITRLDLNVMTHNTVAFKLYEKLGFVTEGTKKSSLKVAGGYVNEYLMAKILA